MPPSFGSAADGVDVRDGVEVQDDVMPTEGIPTEETSTEEKSTEETSADDWDWSEPEDFSFIVRPYSWTRGRTRPAQDLALETLVSTSSQGRAATGIASVEHQAIVELCQEVRSVAEVAALLALPLGIARVLLADVIAMGWVWVHDSPLRSGDQPDLALMERVLTGLRRL